MRRLRLHSGRLLAGGFVLAMFTTELQAQKNPIPDSLSKELEEIIISYNKWELKQNEVPNRITKINRNDIFLNNPQTAADMLQQTGTVFVQKSQLGGGSPMIRGFATNRVLLVVDGVRMNNAIYRSGNLQNVISIDALSLETAEVIFGPGSLIYGSDALGGVMDFHTLQPRLQTDTDKGTLWKGSVISRYSTANNEKTIHADVNVGGKKWSYLSSFTYSNFDDLKMGKQGGQDRYLRPQYVQRVNGIDSIFTNPNPRIQRFSGYEQTNLLQKIRFKPNRHNDFQYTYLYAHTGDVPRYDRLIQYRNGRLRFAEWYYGPMVWQMHNLQWMHRKKTLLYDEMRITAAFQDYEESRIDRTRNSSTRNLQKETVKAYSLNADANLTLGKGKVFYGVEYVFNRVGSTGISTNINTGSTTPIVSRYPDGSTWRSTAMYASYKQNLQENITFTGGLRFNDNKLAATFDNRFIPFPYTDTEIKQAALTGHAGVVYRLPEGWQLNANIATGFRMPNVDDIGKLFESAPGIVTVPNPNLRSEYAWNYELGIVYQPASSLSVELNGFYTRLNNAIVRRPATFNGQDSILFMGVMSRVEALQNAAYATVWGAQLSARWQLSPSLTLITHANWITGKETDDVKDEQVPLRHAPPFYGSTSLRYVYKRLTVELSAVYNNTIRNDRLAPSEQAKPDIYALDSNGKPYAPGWTTWNSRFSFNISKQWLLTAAWENMLNLRYRPYSSGIVAAGSNGILALRYSFE